MKNLNHNDANFEFRSLYTDFRDEVAELEYFLCDVHGYITSRNNRLAKGKIHSQEFNELFVARSNGQIFRDSYLMLVCTIGESYLKAYTLLWIQMLGLNHKDFSYDSGLLDTFKDINKKYLELNIDFSDYRIVDFKGLLAVRNSLIHSNGSFIYVEKSIPIIQQLARKYKSLEIHDSKYIITDEKFCRQSLSIVEKFIFYIFKQGIRKFPNYRTDISEFGL